MSCVVDANVAVKWAVPETGSDEAYAVLQKGGVIAPDLIVAECANILWKKARRGDLSPEEADFCARFIERADFDIIPTRNLVRLATAMAIRLSHPAYDCLYLVVAREHGLTLVTADDRLLRKLQEPASAEYAGLAVSLADAAAGVGAEPQ